MPRRHCHEMIRKVAKDMANEFFEELMRDNERYATWKALCPDLTPALARERFVTLAWPHLIEQARHTLTHMLTLPYDEVLKDQIAEALILDNSLKVRHEHMH